MNYLNAVKTYGNRLTHWLDPGLTTQQVFNRLIVLLLIQIWYIMFAIGTVLGTAENHSPTGQSKTTVINDVWYIEHEIWMDFASADILAKAIFGVMYPVLAIGLWLTEVGIHIGYAIPEFLIDPFMLYVFEYGMPLVLIGITSIFVFYWFDLVYRASKGLRDLRGRLPQ